MLRDRFKTACASAGLSKADTAKLLRVTERTVHNWFSGACAVPYSAYKLVRVLGRFELPAAGWDGWVMQGGRLWTPEGHPIAPTDGSWWSLLVRQARLFHAVHQENGRLRLRLAQIEQPLCDGPGQPSDTASTDARSAAMPAAGAGLVSYKTSGDGTNSHDGINLIPYRHHDAADHAEPEPQPCPPPSASPLSSKPGPRPAPETWASPSMPWSPSPWTLTCVYPRPAPPSLSLAQFCHPPRLSRTAATNPRTLTHPQQVPPAPSHPLPCPDSSAAPRSDSSAANGETSGGRS